tara:strand:+ start:181 stop:402 length:222 start_codon:yes stop_codon:yes gene_type:complete
MKDNDTMENQISHEVKLNDKQIEFLVKCIDISSSIEDLKPDLSESEIIRKLSELNDEIQETKYGHNLVHNDFN